MHHNGKVLFTLFVIFLLSCSGKKTERELYQDATSGIVYKTYDIASRATVGPAIKVYNAQLPDSVAPMDPVYAHLLLGYGWAVSGKAGSAFAEATIAEENDNEEVKFLARSLRSITMYEQGWDSLAREESRRAKMRVPHASVATVQNEAITFYLIMGMAEAYEKDFAQSKFYWAGFATETGIHWPYALADAADDFQNGRTQQGLSKVKIIAQDPAVPQALRVPLAEKIALIESKTGDVNSKFFWPKLISAVVLEEMKQSKNESLAKLVVALDQVAKKLPV